MPAARRQVAVAVALGVGAVTFAAAPASAHGTMGDPVSRVAQCYAENPESPTSDACRAAVAAGGTVTEANAPEPAGSTRTTLAATGGDGSTPYLAIGGAAALALGSSALFLSVRRRAPRR